MNSNATYVDSCSNFATSSCSTGMHLNNINAYQTPNLQNCVDLQNNQQNNLQTNVNGNLTNNILIKNAGIYGNNYTTCANLVSMRTNSNHNLVDEVYLPSPYASTRIQMPKTNLDVETGLKLDHQQQQILIENNKKSFSNIYDIPQQQCLQSAANQMKQANNQNRNNSMSIVSLLIVNKLLLNKLIIDPNSFSLSAVLCVAFSGL